MLVLEEGREFNLEADYKEWADHTPAAGAVLEIYLPDTDYEPAPEVSVGFLVTASAVGPDGSASVEARYLGGGDKDLGKEFSSIFNRRKGWIHLCSGKPCFSDEEFGLHTCRCPQGQTKSKETYPRCWCRPNPRWQRRRACQPSRQAGLTEEEVSKQRLWGCKRCISGRLCWAGRRSSFIVGRCPFTHSTGRVSAGDWDDVGFSTLGVGASLWQGGEETEEDSKAGGDHGKLKGRRATPKAIKDGPTVMRNFEPQHWVDQNRFFIILLSFFYHLVYHCFNHLFIIHFSVIIFLSFNLSFIYHLFSRFLLLYRFIYHVVFSCLHDVYEIWGVSASVSLMCLMCLHFSVWLFFMFVFSILALFCLNHLFWKHFNFIMWNITSETP